MILSSACASPRTRGPGFGLKHNCWQDFVKIVGPTLESWAFLLKFSTWRLVDRATRSSASSLSDDVPKLLNNFNLTSLLRLSDLGPGLYIFQDVHTNLYSKTILESAKELQVEVKHVRESLQRKAKTNETPPELSQLSHELGEVVLIHKKGVPVRIQAKFPCEKPPRSNSKHWDEIVLPVVVEATQAVLAWQWKAAGNEEGAPSEEVVLMAWSAYMARSQCHNMEIPEGALSCRTLILNKYIMD